MRKAAEESAAFLGGPRAISNGRKADFVSRT
jgi:hypothetical protein